MKNFDFSTKVPGRCRQFLAAIIVNLASLLTGISYGWVSPMIPILCSEETPVGASPLTENEASWLVSIMAIGTLIVLPFCGSLSESFGRKLTGIAAAFPFFLCWLLIGLATNFYFILIAQFLNGIGVALSAALCSLYLKEIASDSIRGQLGVTQLLITKVGLVLVYGLGVAMSYTGFAIFAGIIPIIYLGGFLLLPETPIYLVRKNRIDGARRSLMWLRANDESAVDLELSMLQKFVNENMKKGSASLRDLVRNRGTLKGLSMGLVLVFGQQTCGINVILPYTVTIFTMAKSSVDPNLATIIVGVTQLIGAWLSTLLIERTGRRGLLLLSCAGMALCHSILGVFLLIQERDYDVSGFSWIPFVALSIFGLVYAIGVGAIVWVISIEVYNPDVASICNGIALILMAVMCFVITKFFSLAVDAFGLYNCFFFFALSCMSMFVYIYYIIPETRGKTIEAIFNELNGPDEGSKRVDEVNT